MSCCGQKREAMADGVRSEQRSTGYAAPSPRSSFVDRGPVRPPVVTVATPSELAVTLVCRNSAVVSVTGPVTGKRYRFTGAGSMQAIDQRDADGLVATGSFQRV
ncbi:MAG: hypothetical protein LAO55_21725 [Acidobacteriia bacterium]|nr:hypothetical protein [Terriglobia bacterium]